MLNSNDLSIEQIHFLYDENQLTAKQLISMYLERIALFDQAGPTLRSIIEINPDALFIAEALDQERNHYGRTGSLHGIPILLKDNIETKDFMHTSAGSIALEHHRATIDAHLVTKLREEGAIILGKTNMTEFANGMSSTMWAGYSSRGGQFETLMEMSRFLSAVLAPVPALQSPRILHHSLWEPKQMDRFSVHPFKILLLALNQQWG